MALWGLIGSTAKLAEQYAGYESATHKAQRKRIEKETAKWLAGSPGRRARHRNGGMQKAAAEGQRWEDSQRRYGSR